ncbi:MAG: transglutaminase domain-containing protein [Actinomycetota bacterium]|nr:transglutaminase domain-containing protein [Actinomycetota bacterium]
MPGQAIDVDVKDCYAYLTDDLGQLYIIDFADLASPEIIGKVKGIDSANIVIIEGSYAYVSYTSWQEDQGNYYTQCGFKIVDISDPENPDLVGDYVSGSGTEKSVQGIFIQDEYAYLNSTQLVDEEQQSQLEIVDISEKENPEKVSSLNIDGMPWGIHVSGGFAYINTTLYGQEYDLGQQSRLVVVDISDPKNPELVSSCQVVDGAAGIYAQEDFVFISSNTLDFEETDARSYLQIIDVSDKKNPVIRGKCPISGQGWELDMADSYVLVSDLEGGVHAIDISDKDDPEVADIFYSSGTSYDITVEGNYGYIADGFSGISVLSLSGADQRQDSLIIDENQPPVAYMEVSGDSRGKNIYPVGIPVYFSAASSYDLNADDLSFSWNIGEEEYKEEKVSHVFENQGSYTVSLTVSDGTFSSEVSKNIEIKPAKLCVVPVKEKDFEVEIEYQLKNLSQTTLTDIKCNASVPQTYQPFQKIKEVSVNHDNYQTLYDQSFNKILNIDFEDIEIGPSEQLTATVKVSVEMITFDYADIDYDSLSYAEDDPDLSAYTMADLYIDSDSSIIKEAAESVIGREKSPVVIMEKLYYYVIDILDYDFDRAADPQYPLMYASEILQEGSGVCADYAVLYAALLRASGIPCRVASGVPVYTAMLEGGQLDVGHAWVEVKFPQYGWVPIDITIEDFFMSTDYNMNLATERGSGFLHRNTTMDWSSYYFDGFMYSWEGRREAGG